jgi:hypothetical protein
MSFAVSASHRTRRSPRSAGWIDSKSSSNGKREPPLPVARRAAISACRCASRKNCRSCAMLPISVPGYPGPVHSKPITSNCNGRRNASRGAASRVVATALEPASNCPCGDDASAPNPAAR